MIGGRGTMQLVAVATLLLLPRLMPITDYGRFVSVLALVSLGGALVEMGLGWFEMCFIAPARRRGDIAAAVELGSTSLFTKLTLGLVVTLILLGWVALSPGLGILPIDLIWIGLWLFARFGITAYSVIHLPLGLNGCFVGLEVSRALLHLTAAGIGYTWAGLHGTFATLAATHLLLLALSVLILNRSLPLRPASASPRLLWSQRGYGFLSEERCCCSLPACWHCHWPGTVTLGRRGLHCRWSCYTCYTLWALA